MSSSDLPRVCVIGAGSCGIVATKVLRAQGIAVDCYEKGSRIGGNWVIDNDNDVSAAYVGLYINTSRQRMAYSDFPMPESYPDYPHHSQVATYFESYVDHFGFRDSIQFNTGVLKVEPAKEQTWKVTLDDGRVRHYDAVCVANGHHWDPRWPEPAFPGEFSGRVMHSHEYRDPDVLRGQHVLILGMGNSAMDIAVESSYAAERTFLSARRGAHVIPKYLLGKPIDHLSGGAKLPVWLRKAVFKGLVRMAVGKVTDYGLPEPDHEIGEAHPTVSGRILDRLAHGAITPKSNIARLDGDRVHFTDGTTEKISVIVYCTGYKVTFPFFDPDFLSAPDNDLPLYKRTFEPDRPGLFFIGLLQPLGAIMPLAESQSNWIAAYLRGKYALPTVRDMKRDMAREREVMFSRYVKSKRHTMQVDFDEYIEDVEAEMRRGAKRAQSVGARLPIPPRVLNEHGTSLPSDGSLRPRAVDRQ